MCSDQGEAQVFDLNGACMTFEDGIKILSRIAPSHQITTTGSHLPVPADLSDTPIRKALGDYPSVLPEDGIQNAFYAFSKLAAEGRLGIDI